MEICKKNHLEQKCYIPTILKFDQGCIYTAPISYEMYQKSIYLTTVPGINELMKADT